MKRPPGDRPRGGGLPIDPFGGMLGTGPQTPATTAALTQKFKSALVGTWTADLGNGVAEELTYTADGTFTAKLTGPMPTSETGKYTVTKLVGTKGLKIQLDAATGPRTITAIFDGNELDHPTLVKGVSGTFHKK